MTELKNYLKPLTNKNAQLVTRAKPKRADSGKMKDSATKSDTSQICKTLIKNTLTTYNDI